MIIHIWLKQKVGVIGICLRFYLIHTRLHSKLHPHEINFLISCLACELYRSLRRLVLKTYPGVSVCKGNFRGVSRFF